MILARVTLSTIDWIVIATYFGMIAVIVFWAVAQKQKTSTDYWTNYWNFFWIPIT